MSKTKKLKILLYADADVFKMRVGAPHPYVQFFSQFGEVVLVHSSSDIELFAEIGDVLAIPGGADVDPLRYGETPHAYTGRTNIHYETLDKKLLPLFLESGKPVIGICRGSQTVNVSLGGTLHQHIHHHAQKADRHVTTSVMTTIFDSGIKYKKLNVPEIYEINSFHHQSVNELGEGLEIIGYDHSYKGCMSSRINPIHYPLWQFNKQGIVVPVSTDEKGKPHSYKAVVEAFRSNETANHNVLCFQYHPEEFNCVFAINMIDEMLTKHFPEREETKVVDLTSEEVYSQY